MRLGPFAHPRLSLPVLCVLLLSLLLDGLTASADPLRPWASEHRGRPTVALVERAECLAPSRKPIHAPTEVPPASQVLMVVVPARAWVWVDEHGDVVAAMTNTGCAPHPSNRTSVLYPNGEQAEVPGGFFASQRWTGDFTVAGVEVDQAG